jgi:hypothetical protein
MPARGVIWVKRNKDALWRETLPATSARQREPCMRPRSAHTRLHRGYGQAGALRAAVDSGIGIYTPCRQPAGRRAAPRQVCRPRPRLVAFHSECRHPRPPNLHPPSSCLAFRAASTLAWAQPAVVAKLVAPRPGPPVPAAAPAPAPLSLTQHLPAGASHVAACLDSSDCDLSHSAGERSSSGLGHGAGPQHASSHSEASDNNNAGARWQSEQLAYAAGTASCWLGPAR